MQNGSQIWADAIRRVGFMRFPEPAILELGRAVIASIDILAAQLRNERDGEREAREKCQNALRRKDEAMGILWDRLNKAGVDCSDLIS